MTKEKHQKCNGKKINDISQRRFKMKMEKAEQEATQSMTKANLDNKKLVHTAETRRHLAVSHSLSQGG